MEPAGVLIIGVFPSVGMPHGIPGTIPHCVPPPPANNAVARVTPYDARQRVGTFCTDCLLTRPMIYTTAFPTGQFVLFSV